MATLTSLMLAEAAQRDDTASEEAGHQVKGDYFFLFENHVENRFAKPRREPRRKRIFRRFSHRRSKDWRRSRMDPYESTTSPDTTALISEDEHSLMHSHVSGNLYEDDDELLSTSECRPHIIWPETMSLVGDESSPATSPRRDNRKRKVLLKKWKSRMRKSLRDALAKTQSSWSENTEEYAVKVEKADEKSGDDEKSTSTNISLLERAKRSLGVSTRSKGVQRAKAVLHEEEIGLYVNPDDEVETVTRSTFEQLCVPSFPEEARDSPPEFPETVSLDNGYAVAYLMHQGKTSLEVNYDSDFAQLELQSDDEYDPEDDASFTEDEPALPELQNSTSEETEYNLFNQSSVEEDDAPCGRYPSLLAPTSTVSEDPSLLDGASALGLAWPLPQCRNMEEEVVLSGSSEDPLFVQQSTSTETYSVSSRRLGAAPPPASVKKQQEQEQKQALSSSSSSEDEHRLGICPTYAAKSTLKDATDVWKRIYAPPEEAPPSPTIVQKSRATWGCGLDASPVSVNSDISESEAVAPTHHNPFYNIRRYAASCGVLEEEDHPFDEVDSDVCAPRPARQAPEQTTSFGCGVPELVKSFNLSHKDNKEELLGHNIVSKPARPRCECVKCSVTNMYASLLAKNK